MPDLQVLKKKHDTAQDLLSMVKTMKAMAAVNIREYERAQESLNEYNKAVMLAFRGLLRYLPPGKDQRQGRGRMVLLVFGSDQGLCGQFNDRIADHTLDTMKRPGINRQSCLILSVGQRIHDRLLSEGLPIQELLPVPVSPEGITPTVQEIISDIDHWNGQYGIQQVLLEYNHHISGASYEPRLMRLLPLDRQWLEGITEEPWPTRELPVFRMDADTLFSALVRHYLNASLFRAFAESLASENAARLSSMQGAERNIKERLTELKNQYNQERQVSITEELLDIISGFNALEEGEQET